MPSYTVRYTVTIDDAEDPLDAAERVVAGIINREHFPMSLEVIDNATNAMRFVEVDG